MAAVSKDHRASVLFDRLLPPIRTSDDPDDGKPALRSTLPIIPSGRKWINLPFISKTLMPPPDADVLSAMTTLLSGSTTDQGG